MFREDLINFVLENIILTLGRWGFLMTFFNICISCQNLSSVSISDVTVEIFPADDKTLTVSYKNMYKSNSKRYNHTVVTADKDYHRN